MYRLKRSKDTSITDYEYPPSFFYKHRMSNGENTASEAVISTEASRIDFSVFRKPIDYIATTAMAQDYCVSLAGFAWEYIGNSSSMTFINIQSAKASENINKLERISNFETNWNGYNANPIHPSVIQRCRMLLNKLDFQPKLFPTARNSIQFEYQKENEDYIEFEIFSNTINHLKFSKEEGIISTKDISESEMIEIINSFHA